MKSILILNLLLFYVFHIYGQSTATSTVNLTLTTVMLMDIEPSTPLIFDFTAPTEAGEPIIGPAANLTKWINYTSAITENGLSRKITASLSEIIPGVSIKIVALPTSGSGQGILGIPNPEITLNTLSQNLLNGIKGAFTGNGINNGHNLRITLITNDYSALKTLSNKTVMITYTILSE
ncbi:hypothetical protein [Sphingobacterium rhinopitheci]|uniref:hypothetical protein n=1 Tax=Sphingobacterium rhinopitheci TaxID=2781960 RepID=UPI001F524A9A|nr:hypothetical protein [Sphingobacterium rhinopitheci]MCI0921993.1 hypothetical protein [Sphingobacterium rhinopitheci]